MLGSRRNRDGLQGGRAAGYLKWVHGRLPTEPRDLLYGDLRFASLHEAMVFMSVYPVLLGVGGLNRPYPDNDYVQRDRTIRQTLASKELAGWFTERFRSRAHDLGHGVFAPLLARGLDLRDTGETLLFCAMTRYHDWQPYGEVGAGQDTDPVAREVFSLYRSYWPAAFRETDCELMDEHQEQRTDGCPGVDEEEILLLACDRTVRGPALRLVLKHLVPESMDLALQVMAKTQGCAPDPRVYRAFLHVNQEMRAEWAKAARLQRSTLHWYWALADGGRRPSRECGTSVASRPVAARQGSFADLGVAGDDSVWGSTPPPSPSPVVPSRQPLAPAAAHSGCSTRLGEDDVFVAIHRRIEVTPTGLRLQFSEKDRAGRKGLTVWYELNMATGMIVRRAGRTKSDAGDLHFALRRIGRADFALARGQDLALRFLDNIGKTRPTHLQDVGRRAFRNAARDVLDGYLDVLFRGPWAGDVRGARAVSPRPAVAWEVYGIHREFGKDSEEAYRVKTFAARFPALMRVIPRSFLRSVIITGAPLRKTMPYWSPWFREAAEAKAANREEARENLLRAALRSMGASGQDVQAVRAIWLDWLGFHLPFVRQTRTREAFMVWTTRHLADGAISPDELYGLYSYVRAAEHRCDRFTTPTRLRKRRDEWHRREMEQRMLEAIGDNLPFPTAWLGDRWDSGGRRIVYLSDPRSLYIHAKRHVHNCAFLYCDRIRRGEVQLYRIEAADGVAVGTIEVLRDGLGIQLGEHLGPHNEPLAIEDTRIVQRWFHEMASGGRAAAPGDAHLTVPARVCL